MTNHTQDKDDDFMKFDDESGLVSICIDNVESIHKTLGILIGSIQQPLPQSVQYLFHQLTDAAFQFGRDDSIAKLLEKLNIYCLKDKAFGGNDIHLFMRFLIDRKSNNFSNFGYDDKASFISACENILKINPKDIDVLIMPFIMGFLPTLISDIVENQRQVSDGIGDNANLRTSELAKNFFEQRRQGDEKSSLPKKLINQAYAILSQMVDENDVGLLLDELMKKHQEKQFVVASDTMN